MSQNNTNQSLLPFGAIVTENISRVFGTKDIKNAKGANVGTSIVMQGRKEIASALGLKPKADKEAIDTAILKASDEAFRKVKSEVAGLNGDWTLHKVANRTIGDGVRQVTMVIREVKRKTGPSDEAIAKAWYPEAQFPDMTLEEKVAKIVALREKEVAELASHAVTDV